jgi:AcrR family transcriptional regulator
VSNAPELSRRARVREATLVEIRQTARRLVADGSGDGLSLRAVARQMGMTAPALYRYVDSQEELVQLVVVDCYDELVADLERSRDRPRAASEPERLLAMCRTFRRWSMTHPREFGLVFANPVTALAGLCEGEAEQASQRFGQVFARQFVAAVGTSGPHLPAAEDLDPIFARKLEHLDPEAAAALPLGLQYLFVVSWVHLYGCVCMEVFGHLGWAMDDAEPVFEDMLRELAERVGLSEAYRRPARRPPRERTAS